MENDITSVFSSVTGILIGVLIFAGVSFVFSLISYSILKKYPRTYFFSFFPVIIYPYAYIIVSLLLGMVSEKNMDFVLPVTLVLLFLLIHPMCLASAIVTFRAGRNNIIPANKLANGILLVKLIHIPAFILHFILGSFGVLASVWGIGIIMFAVLIDLFTIIVSGTYSVTAITGLYKQNSVSKPAAIIFAVLSYIYCVDVIAAIVLRVIVSQTNKSKQMINT